ncbi:hypothetical protein AB0C51_04855 [Streptomyces pathocidini]|uniref:hypothetical protein n=1 Tax=Streptomyces pathocidini TaxID=1650571 RepID=UPI0033DD6074
MTTAETARFVRLRVELVLEVTDSGELTGAALDHIDADESMPDNERGHAKASVQEDEAEALAYLVDPFDLIGGVPGTELTQASWTSEEIDYDPSSDEWSLDLDDDYDEDDEEGDGDGAADGEEEEGPEGRDLRDLDGSGFIREDEERPRGKGAAGRP